MDPITQGLIGASLPQAVAPNRRLLLWAGCFGFFAGMLPDLDVLIRSTSDPLLFLEFHRQFTHAFIFIPVGGLIAAAIFHLLFRNRSGLVFGKVWFYCTLGYATHGLLDAFTSYGTVLWWPFSDDRISFSIVSVVDPLFSLPVLVLVILAAARGRSKFAIAALLWAGLYLGTATIQKNAARDMGVSLAKSRGHTPSRLVAKPSFGNILVWKTVYEADGRFFVDAVRAGIAPRIFPGASVPKFDFARDLPALGPGSRQARDVARFNRLSEGYLARDPRVPGRIVDIRYSMVPNEIDALWSVAVSADAGPEVPVTFQTHRGDPAQGLRRLWSMLFAPSR
ncbi:MAG: metal-dependent hydrolase [Rhodospirillaceae bacterium]|nr:metal-dependent hydrolase [Rhodospirillaceae bacterium]